MMSIKKIQLIIIFLSIFSIDYAQVISGKVIDATNESPIAFANVYITKVKDTTKIVESTISDIRGNYYLSANNPDKYIIYCNSIGYMKEFDTVELYNNKKYNLSLTPETNQIEAIQISANPNHKDIIKKTIFVNDNMKKKATSSFDILENIAEITVNSLDKTLTTKKNGEVKILINGLEADELELLSINPKNILKIEYFDIVPAKYSNTNVEGVVNVVTKKSLNGFNGNIDLQNAAFTGFNDNYLSLNYIKNNIKINFNYFFSCRNYSEKSFNENLTYTINNEKIEKEKTGIKSPFEYQLHDINLKLINKKDSNYIFQINFKPFIFSHKTSLTQHINYVTYNANINGESKFTQNLKNIQPKLDIYYEKQLNNKTKIIFDAFYSYLKSYYQYTVNEANQDTILLNITTQNINKKHSVIPELLIEHQINKGSYSIGARFFSAYTYQEINNNINETKFYTLNRLSDIYTDITKKYSKISLYAKLGLNYAMYSDISNNYNFLSLKTSFTAAYAINKTSQIRINASQIPIIPKLSQLSNAIIPIDNYIIYTGNSRLQPYLQQNFDISYYFIGKKLILSPTILYLYAKNQIANIYQLNENTIVKTFYNIECNNELNLSLNVTYKPFSQRYIDFNIYAEVYRQTNQINKLLNTNIDYFVKTNISGYYKNFIFKFTYKTDYDMLQGDFINTYAAFSNFEVNYKYKNFLVGLILYYPFSKAWSASDKTVNTSLVQRYSQTLIYDNGKMFVFHISYNFSLGKTDFKTEKKLKNDDNDNGILQRN